MPENNVVSNLRGLVKADGKVPAPTPTYKQDEVHYRVVQEEEIQLLHPLFQRLGWAMPDPDMGKVVVAEAGTGEGALILGLCVVQFIPHAEPMWVHPEMRGTGLAEGLIAHVQHYLEVDCHIKRYVSTAKPDSFAAKLCEKFGMQPWPGQVFVRQIE